MMIWTVDAFTNRPYTGNPAAVCIVEGREDCDWMKLIAREMNCSETAFITKRAPQLFGLRWFTPTIEVDLCGHGTLAAAHLLWEEKIVEHHEPIVFDTRSGLLTATRQGDKIVLDFPAQSYEQCPVTPDLVKALGMTPQSAYVTDGNLFAVMDTEEDVRSMQPDFSAILKTGYRSIAVTAPANPNTPFDIVSRDFAPAVGINEDPVTGSLHCRIGPYWSARLGKTTLNAYQASERGGQMTVTMLGDRVHLLGQAVTTLKGQLLQK